MVALVQIKVKRYGRLFDVEGNIKNDLFEIRGLWMKPLNPKKSDKRETIYLPTEEIMTQITNAVWKLYNIKISDIGTNLWRGGSVIIPLTPDEAKAWCEEQITYEE